MSDTVYLSFSLWFTSLSMIISRSIQSVQFICSVVSDSVTPRTTAHQASLSIPNSWSLLKFMSISLWCHPTISSSFVPFSFCLQSFPATGSFPMNELPLHIRWSKYWSFSFSISPSNEYSGLISFRINWFDLLVGQGTLKSLLQCHSSEASILWCSAFFLVQLTSTPSSSAFIGPTLFSLFKQTYLY